MKKLLITLATILLFLSCTKDANNPLIGYWSRSYKVPVCNVYTTESYEFRSNGLCIHMRSSERIDAGYSGETHPINESFDYTIIDEHYVSIKGNKVHYSVSEDRKTLSFNGKTFKR